MSYNFDGMSPADLRAYAQSCRTESARSYRDSDTDGFLSQAANDVTARVYDLQAEIVENGGRASFLALYDLEGNVVPAVQIDSQFGRNEKVWMLLDGRRGCGKYFNPSKAKAEGVARKNDAKKGFYVGYADFPAQATVGGNRTTFYARAEQLDDRDFSDVIATDNGINDVPDAERWYRVQDGRFSQGR